MPVSFQYPLDVERRFAQGAGQAPTQRRRWLAAGLGALGVGWLLPGLARTHAWPSKPIKIVAAQAPGSSNDATARALAEYITARPNTPAVAENRSGGIGSIAAENVARAAPDGSALLITLHSRLAQAPVLLKKVPIDTTKDLSHDKGRHRRPRRGEALHAM